MAKSDPCLTCCACLCISAVVIGCIVGGFYMVIYGSQGVHDNTGDFARNVCLIIFGVIIIICCCFGGGAGGVKYQQSQASPV